MEKMKIDNFKIENDKYVVNFGENILLGKVLVKLKNINNLDDNNIVTVKYAQNGITTDLILFGEKSIDKSTCLDFEVDIPVSASHIYVCIPLNAEIENIEVYKVVKKLLDPYPKYFDKDLKENYFIDEISVFTPQDAYFHYSVYTSLDGVNFDFIAAKNSSDICNPESGDVYPVNGKEARIIRVYLEYNSNSIEAIINEIRCVGRKSGTSIKDREPLNIPEYTDSKFNVDVTESDAIDEVYGIIERTVGEAYKEWFNFEIGDNPIEGHQYDFFQLTDKNDKICIKGNNGISLAVGLNHYLKYYCKVNISQVGDQNQMPKKIIKLNRTVFKETKAKVRYSYNYCTLSYTMAFWGENEWRKELDWLALNGVNVILDLTAQEEVWRRFLTKLGYSHEEVKNYIVGPAYYAWAYMANMFGFGGPVHDNWFSERSELARKNHLIMRKLGMYPVLQGYSGMVPCDIAEKDSRVEVLSQGTWNSFLRPSMLKTTSPEFYRYAEKFYQAQKEVFGDYSVYYATDPFHEGGKIGDMSPRSVSRNVLDAMLKANPNSVWIIQSWQRNPTSEFLAGLNDVENGREHALILDLYAEKKPNYGNGNKDNIAHGYSPEFDNTPWVFCMLNNFGGRLGLHGHLDNLHNNIPLVFNSCKKIHGIGITPEGSGNNPALYDFLFDCIWQDNADEELPLVNMDKWIHDYATRRYGKESKNADEAWKILRETVYKGSSNMLGQGAPECILNARPSLNIKAASTWGNSIISYDKQKLIEAAKLLLGEYDTLKDSEGYKYDLVTICQQCLSNKIQDCYEEMCSAYLNKDIADFKLKAEVFLSIADKMEKLLSTNKYYMLGTWMEQAKALGNNSDDFTRRLYEINAKSQITTWGSYNQAEMGALHDYSNRQWAGLIGTFYKPRWERWIKARINELDGKPYEDKINWFEWEWKWVRDEFQYSNTPEPSDIKTLMNDIL